MTKKVRANRPIERATVNAIRTFLDKHNIPFMEVDNDVDYGKDFYVELASRNVVSGQVIALQAKGGEQTYRGRQEELVRGIRYTADDCTVFRKSNVPVIGMVSDESRNELLWVNLSAHCSAKFETNQKDSGGFAVTSNRLNDYHLPAFVDEMAVITSTIRQESALNLVSDDLDRQLSAIVDCFFLGRRDYRPLLLIRRMLTWFTNDRALGLAIRVLAHAVPHGDIYFHSKNTIDYAVGQRVQMETLWSPIEIAHLIGYLDEDDDDDMWGRGSSGQDIIMLILGNERNSAVLLHLVTDKGVALYVRQRAFVIGLYMASFPGDDELAEEFLNAATELLEDEWIKEVVGVYREFGYLDIF